MGISHAYNYIIAGSDLRVKPFFRARIWMLLKLPAELEEFAMEKSKVAVRYFSKSGNTKKLADEIARDGRLPSRTDYCADRWQH